MKLLSNIAFGIMISVASTSMVQATYKHRYQDVLKAKVMISDPNNQKGPLEQCMANSGAMPILCKGLPSGKNGLDDIIKNN